MSQVDSAAVPLRAIKLENTAVPTFWIPSSGAYAAGLVFHAGRAMEPMARQGITRIVERAVLASLDLPVPRSSVRDTTSFTTTGDAQHVSAFAYRVTAALASPPLEFVDSVREKVWAEGEPSPLTAAAVLARLRYGFTGPGAGELAAYGARKSGHRQVISWASHHFHSKNAAFWLVGPDAAELPTLLVSGPTVTARDDLRDVSTPGIAVGPDATVGFSVFTRRSAALTAGFAILASRLKYELVQASGLASDVTVRVEERSERRVEISLLIGARVETADAVATAAYTALRTAAATPPGSAELQAFRDQRLAQLSAPSRARIIASAAATATVLRRRVDNPDRLWTELQDLTPEAVPSAMAEALSSLLFVAPSAAQTLHRDLPNVELVGSEALQGSATAPVRRLGEKKIDRELTVGTNGVTLRIGKRTTTIRYEACGVLIVHAASGNRELLSTSGERLFLDREEWNLSDSLLERLDASVAPANRVLHQSVPGVVSSERRRRSRTPEEDDD